VCLCTQSQTKRPKKDLKEVFKNASDLALDLINKLLAFDPNQRITVIDVSDAYLIKMQDPSLLIVAVVLRQYFDRMAHASNVPLPFCRLFDMATSMACLTSRRI